MSLGRFDVDHKLTGGSNLSTHPYVVFWELRKLDVNRVGGGTRRVGDDPAASALPSRLGARVGQQSPQLVPVLCPYQLVLGGVPGIRSQQ